MFPHNDCVVTSVSSCHDKLSGIFWLNWNVPNFCLKYHFYKVNHWCSITPSDIKGMKVFHHFWWWNTFITFSASQSQILCFSNYTFLSSHPLSAQSLILQVRERKFIPPLKLCVSMMPLDKCVICLWDNRQSPSVSCLLKSINPCARQAL